MTPAPASSGNLLARWRAVPLQRKLVFATVGTSLVTILLVSVALFGHQAARLREQFRADHEALARLVADYAAAPVSFNDTRGQEDALAVLRTRQEVVSAELRSTEGRTLALLGQPIPPGTALPSDGTGWFLSWNLTVVQPLLVGQERLGQLILVSTFRPAFRDALASFLPALGLVILGALLILVPATWWLGAILLAGLNRLGRSAARIAETGDYSIRAEPGSADEIGRLVDNFNSMLDRLQQADRDLRTTNAALNHEIAERERLERELVSSSRLAGMAEVATGVLHNVGNVLNSVNVSANLLREQVGANPHLHLLQKTSTLLREQGENLPRFLHEDPRGRLVPQLVLEISDGLAHWRTELNRELTSLGDNISHIKQIVTVQQSHAKAGGVLQTFDPTEIFTDSLRLASLSITRHSISLSTEAPPKRPAITTDRHLVLQVMVNLVRNAIQAVKVRPVGQRLVKLRLTVAGNRVFFAVQDNGIGIAPENRHKLFQHGFTTRKDGHGFGLHSGALAAANLGGSLGMESDGPDRGATFTLELPLSR